MKLFAKVCVLVASVAFLGGCAHGIQITPKIEDIRSVEVARQIDKNVGYYISDADKLKEVITAGGGGDKVKYKPYADTEAALNAMLSNIFSKVYAVQDLNDSAYISDKNITYVFQPSIVTNSSSDSAFTWPPTDFDVELTCTVINEDGKTVWIKTVKASGNAEFDEFKSDFSLSARRASESAFKKMMVEISSAKEL